MDKKMKKPLLFGAALVLFLLVGGLMAYLQPGEKEGEKGREEKGGKKGKKGGIAKQWGPLGRRGQRQAREASAVVGPPWKSRVSAQSSEARLVADIRFPCSKGPRVGVVK